MKTGEFPASKVLAVLGGFVAVALVGAMLYMTAMTSNMPQMSPANAVNIIKAAHNYTRDLRNAKQLIPASVPLTELVSRKYLDPNDAAPFSGLETTLYLLASNNSPKAVLMRVRMSDGSQTVLLSAGSSQQYPAGAKAP
jgi:hypothetical protein